MVTVSTSLSTARSYHHGDLRGALINEGLKALEASGEADISLRQLAREVGVSATAVYRHFPDKHALLAALAHAGLERLGEYQQAAAQAAGAGSNGFVDTGRAYVRFAIANPALFRLIFSHSETGFTALSRNNLAGRMLSDYALGISGGDNERAEQVQIQAWAIVHGLAMLILDGRLPADDALIDRTIDAQSLFSRNQGSSKLASP